LHSNEAREEAIASSNSPSRKTLKTEFLRSKNEGEEEGESFFDYRGFLKSEPEASDRERQYEVLEEGERLTLYYHYG